MSKLAKVAKQHEKTWAQLHRRLISIPFDYDCLFPSPVAEFVNKKAASLGSCPGYLVPCLLTSTAYIIAQNFVLRSGLQDMPQNLYMVFVGSPGTGKSQALKEGALQPMHNVRTERDMQNCIIEKCTSSALVKTVAEHNKAFIVSPEVFEVLNKLLNRTRITQLAMCRFYVSFSPVKVHHTDLQRKEPARYQPIFLFPYWDPPKYPTPHDYSVAWTRAIAYWTVSCFYFRFAYAQLPLRQKKPAPGSKVKK